MKYRISDIDKQFSILEYVNKEYKAKEVKRTNDNGFIATGSYLPILDNVIIYPKELTGEEYDQVTGEVFKEINSKHQDFMKYPPTKFIQLIKGCSYTEAKNKAKKYITQEVQEQGGEVSEEKKCFLVDENNKPQKRWENMDILLEQRGLSVKYNEMSKKIEFAGIEHMEDMADTTFTKIRSLCLDYGFKFSKDDTFDFIQVIAGNNRYNPIAEYLNNCKATYPKDGYGEITRLLGTIKYNTTDKKRIAFCNDMLMKWFVNCVHMAFNEIGSNRTCEVVPTFQGQQGKGKSKWVKSIVPQGYFLGDVILNLESTDNISMVLSYWIAELGEISGTFKKSEQNKLKAFITSDRDTWRNPYGRCNNTYPRRTCFIATVNDKEFLVDKTGNRRFFVIPAESLDYQHTVNVDKFWGEVMHLHDEFITKNAPFYMTDKEQEQNEIYNREYTTKTDTEIIIDDLFDWDSTELGACKMVDIVEYIRQKTGKQMSPNAIKLILQQHNCEYSKFTAGEKDNRKQDRYWKIPFIQGVTLPF